MNAIQGKPDNSSKVTIVTYPREVKLTKEQLAKTSAVAGAMAALSVGGAFVQGNDGEYLSVKMSSSPDHRGLPRNWFTGDSFFRIEIKRVLTADGFNTLFHWARAEKVPCFKAEINGEEPALLVIGPYWSSVIDDLINRAITAGSDIREFSSEEDIRVT